jgi:NTP pyrophosphatase (non-canonical NTP hydrolase)
MPFDYIEETDKTASGVFNPENVGIIEFTNALAAAIHAGEEMNKFKKALFRKQTREEAGLLPLQPQPLLSDALRDRAEEFDDLFHGTVGLITETGEMAEIIYKFLAANVEPDVVNVREEIGDNLWYLSRLVKWAKSTFAAEMHRNIEKLRNRHGAGGFNKERDINRDLDAEHAVLEGEAEV